MIGEKTRLTIGDVDVREVRSLREDLPRVSLVFPAFNRLAFTKQSWWALQANTDWSRVKEFHVYDDGSTDGTAEWLAKAPSFLPPIFHHTNYRSPMGVTLDWIRCADAEILAKLDNDTVYPPDWLGIALGVLDRNPDLHMLGLEAMRAVAKPLFNGRPPFYSVDQSFGYLPAKFISGLGLYRASAFRRSLPQDGGYFGLEEWQMAQRGLRYGWILPSLPVFLLDRLPIQPWAGLSEQYVRAGWQRPLLNQTALAPGVTASPASSYDPGEHDKWDWWVPYQETEP